MIDSMSRALAWTMPSYGRGARVVLDRVCSSIAIAAVLITTFTTLAAVKHDEAGKPVAKSVAGLDALAETPTGVAPRETMVGGYGGMSDTRDSVVSIVKPGQVDMTIKDFAWQGRPFQAPIYYGVRIQRWQPVSGIGHMIDFTHAKAIANADDLATMSGTRDGAAVPAKGKIGDSFRHLEFSHGHNLLTYNGLFRWPSLGLRVRPYVGAGAGITLPHTEIGFRDKNTRTYEYQFAGFVGQVLGGLEFDLGATRVFFEYKFSYAPYEVPLSEEPRGFILFTDLWRQFRAWMSGETPPGGRLSTLLATNHGIGGLLVRVGPAAVGAR